MSTLADIKDKALRETLQSIDELIAEGDYTAASRKAVEAYLYIVEEHPEFIPPPPNPNLAPQHTDTLPANRSRGGGGGIGGMGRAGWPNQGSIRISFDADGTPHVSYEKQRFSMAEASTYFEFVMEEALRAERA